METALHCIPGADYSPLPSSFTSRCPKSLRAPQVTQPRVARPAISAWSDEAANVEAAQPDRIDPSAANTNHLATLGRPPISPQRPKQRPPCDPTQPTVERFGFRFTLEAIARVESLRKNSSPFHPSFRSPVLSPQLAPHKGKVTLVLDIDETLVHASFHPRTGVEYNLALDLQAGGVTQTVFVAYRPGLRAFLRSVAELFEVIAFTSSRSVYANMLLDALDPEGTLFSARLFREHCTEVSGVNVKDLAILNRPLERVIMVDNSPHGYLFQPRNGVPIQSWFSDPRDTALRDLLPTFLEVATCESVYPVLDALNAHYISQQQHLGSHNSNLLH